MGYQITWKNQGPNGFGFQVSACTWRVAPGASRSVASSSERRFRHRPTDVCRVNWSKNVMTAMALLVAMPFASSPSELVRLCFLRAQDGPGMDPEW